MKRFFAFVLFGFILGGLFSVGTNLRVFGREPDTRLNKSGIALLLELDELAWKSVTQRQKERFLAAREEVRARMYGSYISGEVSLHHLLDSLFLKHFNALERIRAIDILRSDFPDTEVRRELGFLRQRLFQETDPKEFPRKRIRQSLDALADFVGELRREETSAGKGREAALAADQAGDLFVSHLYARSFGRASLSYVSLAGFFLDAFYSHSAGSRYIRVLENQFDRIDLDSLNEKERLLHQELESLLAELIILTGQEKGIDSLLVLRVKSYLYAF